jgi:glutamate formiminotransferase/formiminotetrahydrofolate cyclodeaminase
MISDANASVNDFLIALAAKRPAPGGGSVAALAGALAAAMGEMVLNYSVGKKDLAQHEPALREALNELTRARALLVELLIEDQLAFEKLTAARKACNNAGDKDPTFAAALLACIRIPQTIGATAAAILELCERVTPMVNKYLLSDLAVCAEMAMATVRCAAYNVRVNLADVSDATERKHFEASVEVLVKKSVGLIQRTIPAIWARMM